MVIFFISFKCIKQHASQSDNLSKSSTHLTLHIVITMLLQCYRLYFLCCTSHPHGGDYESQGMETWTVSCGADESPVNSQGWHCGQRKLANFLWVPSWWRNCWVYLCDVLLPTGPCLPLAPDHTDRRGNHRQWRLLNPKRWTVVHNVLVIYPSLWFPLLCWPPIDYFCSAVFYKSTTLVSMQQGLWWAL